MNPESWTADTLLERLQRGDRFFILDVRGREDFDRFHIEGAPILNVPYFEMIEPGGGSDGLESIVRYVDRNLGGRLPSDLPILAVCNKGFTSELVSLGLSRLGYSSATFKGGMRGWGDHYAIRAITDRPDLAIYQIGRPARGCLSYVAASAGKAVVIDPLRHPDPYLALAREAGFTVTAVIDTHGHADHISGGTAIAARTGAPYYLHPHDAVHPIDLLPAVIPFEFLREGQAFRLGRHELKVLHVPGHTLGMVALQLDEKYLFSGDSIFIQSVSRPDLGGKAESWAPLHARSLRRLSLLQELDDEHRDLIDLNQPATVQIRESVGQFTTDPGPIARLVAELDTESCATDLLDSLDGSL
jgi:glyoxylase-like metal-dependent hydrolase (beta-lactamase superfamily II)/rhodanese-related sulfurtransferase